MDGHRITIVGERDRCQARCQCERRSAISDRGGVEQWVYEHHTEIERIRARLGTRSPSLKTQLDWYKAKIADPDTTPDDRELWQRLADELCEWMESKKPGPVPANQLTLW